MYCAKGSTCAEVCLCLHAVSGVAVCAVVLVVVRFATIQLVAVFVVVLAPLAR